MYTRFVSNILFPLHERLKKHDSVAVLKELEASQWWSSEEIEQHRLRKLRAFLQFAQKNVPYYQRIFKEYSFNPCIESLNALSQLPILEKSHIRANVDEFKSVCAGELKRSNTGGSSGEPLVFFMGRGRISHDVAAKWRATRWWGVDIGDKEVVVWGSPIELGAQDKVRMIRDRLLRTTLLPAFEMSDEKLSQFVSDIRVFKPKMLFGYPSSLSLIARYARDQGLVLGDLGIKVAFVTSERLYDDQRAIISEVFACPVANGYGGRDAGFLAHECPHGGMHISAEDIIVETVGSEGAPVAKGEVGEVVVTHLASHDFPFIRYRTGDMAVLDDAQCGCGRGLPMLKEIQGRTTDFIIAANGTVMHGLALIYILRDLPEVGLFKIIQESLDKTRVLIVPAAGFTQEMIAKIKEDFRRRLGEAVQVDVELVERIPREKNGKFRYVVSKVAA